MNHHSRRACSPSFGYDPRPMDGRPAYEDPYSQYNGPPPPLAPGGPPAYMDQHGYQISYRERPSGIPPSYRASAGQREQFPIAGLPSSPAYPHRASSPPYKILCITNINPKIDDNTVKEALTSDYSRFGIASVSVCHDNGERLAYIYFQNYEEAREARHVKSRTLFFDRPVEIEPIYDPRGEVNSSPIDASPTSMAPSVPPMYPPRRRSMTPEYPPDINGPMFSRNQQQQPYPHHTQGPPPPMHHHRGISPVEYPPIPNAVPYPYGPSPTPMGPAPIPSDRRTAHSAGYGPPSGMHPHPDYASPPHDPYRASYPPPQHVGHHQFEQLSAPYGSDPYGGPNHHMMMRGERDRLSNDGGYMRSRSPRSDPYYPQRGAFPPVPTHHYPSSRSAHSSSSSHHPSNPDLSPSIHQHSSPAGKYRQSPPVSAQHHRNRPDPPARYLSREFRREKFGSEHYNSEHDDGRPSRVLLVTNIDSSKTISDLKELFKPFGIVEEMEMKEVASGIASALIKFTSMDGAYKAKTANDGRHIGSTRCRIVYGKISASRRLWIGGLSPSTTVSGLEEECCKYGDLINIDYTSGRPYAYVEYGSANQAQCAAHHMKTILTPANERKIRIEFVDPERIEKLVPSLETNLLGSKSRSTKENWSSGDLEPSPQLSGGRKRSSTPSDSSSVKRLCPSEDLPIVSNTFKQERLAAAAAAKARTSSLTTSTTSTPLESDELDKTRQLDEARTELNNNGNDNGQTSFSNSSRDQSTENNAKDAPSLDELNESTSIHQIVQHCTVSWPSQITLRNFTFPARIYLCCGRRQLIDKHFMKLSNAKENGSGGGEDCCPMLHITQRWRLHPQPKLEEVKRRMQSGNSGYLIIVARHEEVDSSPSVSISEKPTTVGNCSKETTAPVESNQQESNINHHHNQEDFASLTSQTKTEPSESNEPNTSDTSIRAGPDDAKQSSHNNTPTISQTAQIRPLRNLISYLEQKDAAGVISLGSFDGAGANDQTATANNEMGSSSKLLYAFPPGDFALNLIKRKAPNLTPEAMQEEFLLGVIVGSHEAKI